MHWLVRLSPAVILLCWAATLTLHFVWLALLAVTAIAAELERLNT